MATTAAKLTYEQFQEQYGQADRAYEFWYGEAVPKGMPTIIHGLLQGIIMQLLREAGLIAASDVEIRIDPEARPRPDVIAARKKLSGRYLTEGCDVAVEIISEDEKYPILKDKCRKYQAWGVALIYLVDPADRSVAQWTDDGRISPCSELAGIPVERIWKALDEQYSS